MNPLSLLLGLVAAVGVLLLANGIRSARGSDAATMARARLARQEIGLGQSAVAIELEKPLVERLREPGRRWLNRQMSRMTPAARAATFRRQLDFVGAPLGLDPAGMEILRIAAAAGLGALGTAVGVLIGQPLAIGIGLLVGVAFGFYLLFCGWMSSCASVERSSRQYFPTRSMWWQSAWRRDSGSIAHSSSSFVTRRGR
jgi:hypothetical protein